MRLASGVTSDDWFINSYGKGDADMLMVQGELCQSNTKEISLRVCLSACMFNCIRIITTMYETGPSDPVWRGPAEGGAVPKATPARKYSLATIQGSESYYS